MDHDSTKRGAILASSPESISSGVGEIVEGDGKIGELKRQFSARHIHIIAVGCKIGTGLFIGTGRALSRGGPGGLVVGYMSIGITVWAALQVMTEMAIAFPRSGSFVEYADRWVDPSIAFAAGFAEWLGWTAVIGSEAVAFSIMANYWAQESVNDAVWYTIFIVVVFAVFVLPVKWFAWFEYWTSLIKVLALFIFIIAASAVCAGAGPTGKRVNGSTWREYPVFKNGFEGTAGNMLLALWAYGDMVFSVIMGGEAAEPRYSMARAVKLISFRVIFVYGVIIMFVTLLVPSDDHRLLGSTSSVGTSPLVISLLIAGVRGLPDFLNAVMMIGVAAIAGESIYVASRVLRSMAVQKLIPTWFGGTDNEGRPRNALYITCAFGTLFTYLNLSASGIVGFTWLVSITSSSFFIVWILVAITCFRMHAAIKAQKSKIFEEPWAYRCTWYPFTPLFLLAMSLFLMATCLYVGLSPIGINKASAYYFFQYNVGTCIVLVFTLAYKLIFRTPFRDVNTADITSGRRPLTLPEIERLDKYYAMPMWRRFATYFELW